MGVNPTKILTLSDYTTQFYEQNEAFLLSNYPGLQKRIFLQKLVDYCLLNQIVISAPETRFYGFAKSAPLKKFFEQVLQGRPFEYILGRASFYRSEFFVNEKVLIPRSETEILVEYAVKHLKSLSLSCSVPLKVGDMGTGSGAIILSLVRECSFAIEATATDICPEALKVARRNLFNFQYTHPEQSNIKIYQGDRLTPFTEPQHMIVSNPPYIKAKRDLSTVHEQVHQFEPHLALYLEDSDYGQWYKDLFLGLPNVLVPDGLFIMEGHEDHLEDLANLARECGLNVKELVKDYTQRTRFLVLQNKR